MAELTYPFTLHVEPIDQDESLAEIDSYADLLGELEGAAEVSRDEADALAEKILRGQEVNVAAMGTGLRLYATKGEERRGGAALSTGDDVAGTAPLPDEQAEVLELLRRDEAQNRLVHDDTDRRWYLYEFTEEPPRITDVRKDVAEALLEGGQVTHVEEEVRRVELPGGFSVYVSADAGESTRRA